MTVLMKSVSVKYVEDTELSVLLNLFCRFGAFFNGKNVCRGLRVDCSSIVWEAH